MKTLSAYCTAILVAFAAATHQGYAVSSLFGNHHRSEPGERSAAAYHK
jgi:hypothetical protein